MGGAPSQEVRLMGAAWGHSRLVTAASSCEAASHGRHPHPLRLPRQYLPLAEGVFRRVAEEEGLIDRFEIDSAGLGDWHIGQAPDHRAQKAARSRGIDISSQSARQVVYEDFDRFDLVLAMDGSNLAELKARAPHEARGKIRPFLDFAPHVGTKDVPDPFFGGAEGFDHVLDLIEAASRGLLASLTGKEKVRAKRGA